ncbi:hypothetical protein V2J09_000966 [Rumex salicifolius]
MKKPYKLIGGRLLYQGRICIPATSQWIPKLLEEFHSAPAGGHSGALRTYKRLSANQFLPGEFVVAAVAEEFWNRDEIIRQLKFNLDRAQKRMVRYANKQRRELSFNVGDLVFLKLRPHRQSTLLHRVNQKLAPKFFGPFSILRKIGEVAYELCLPANSRIHPVFHVSLLKRAMGDHKVVVDLPKDLIMTDEEFLPADILEFLKETSRTGACHRVLVLWDNKPRDEATWMSCADFKLQFPGSNLVDKVCSEGGGIVRVDGYIVYGRKKKRVPAGHMA